MVAKVSKPAPTVAEMTLYLLIPSSLPLWAHRKTTLPSSFRVRRSKSLSSGQYNLDRLRYDLQSFLWGQPDLHSQSQDGQNYTVKPRLKNKQKDSGGFLDSRIWKEHRLPNRVIKNKMLISGHRYLRAICYSSLPSLSNSYLFSSPENYMEVGRENTVDLSPSIFCLYLKLLMFLS